MFNTIREVIRLEYEKNADCIRGVTCRVENCVYHAEGNLCAAKSIDVKNESARTKAETFCGTFAPVNRWQ